MVRSGLSRGSTAVPTFTALAVFPTVASWPAVPGSSWLVRDKARPGAGKRFDRPATSLGSRPWFRRKAECCSSPDKAEFGRRSWTMASEMEGGILERAAFFIIRWRRTYILLNILLTVVMIVGA